MQGQSTDYTPLKQAQLTSLLDACRHAWQKPHSFASPERCFIDCMAGSGHDEQGNPGSPLIFQDYAKNFCYPIVAWCDKDRKFTSRLETCKTERFVTVLTGRYQDEVLRFMAGVPANAMGVIYLDDNGCQQVWEDDGFLRHVMTNYRFVDVAIHFSENAWKRNSSAHNSWAEQKHVMEVFELILHYKPQSVIYAPRIRHNWRLVYGCASGKMDLRGQQRIKLRDYIESRPENQMSLLEGIG